MHLCSAQTMGYALWSQRLHERTLGQRIPLVVSLELTFRCNNACHHCYCNKPANDQREMAAEMSTAEVCARLDEAADMGALWLLLTGGEPLLRRDFRDIYLHAKRRGMLVMLFTNATLIDEAMAAFLGEYRPFLVEVSLYGSTEEVYREVAAGSYERAVAGIGALLDRRVPLALKCCVTRGNAHDVHNVRAFALERGLEFRIDALITPRAAHADQGRDSTISRLSPEEAVALEMSLPEIRAEWLALAGRVEGFRFPRELYACGAGSQSMHIDPYGRAHMCLMGRGHEEPEPLSNAWHGRMSEARALKAPKGQCAECDVALFCEQCAGWSHAVHGAYGQPIDFLCRVARLRAGSLGV